MSFADGGSGTIENLSSSGVLVQMAGSAPTAPARNQCSPVRIEIGGHRRSVAARPVRVQADRVALELLDVDDYTRALIDDAIALAIAERRSVLVVDDHASRRSDLVEKLAARGMTPFAPRTPLEAIHLMTRATVDVALLAHSFGQSSAELRTLFADSFPRVVVADISDDVEATVDRAASAWSARHAYT